MSRGSLAGSRFRPRRPAPPARLILAAVIGPILWVCASVLVAVVDRRSTMVGLGLVVTTVSFVVATAVLLALRRGRRREEHRAARA